MLSIGIISDTHNLLRDAVKKALAPCDAILHAGDVCRAELLEELAAIAPVFAVRGNNDGGWAACLPERRVVELAGRRFFMIHDKMRITEVPEDCDIVIYGHSHKYEERRLQGRLWLNPGSCGPPRFRLPVTMAVMEVEESGDYHINQLVLASEMQEDIFVPAYTKDLKKIVRSVVREVDRGKPVGDIAASLGIAEKLAERICRLYVTHPGIDTDGIMGKM